MPIRIQSFIISLVVLSFLPFAQISWAQQTTPQQGPTKQKQGPAFVSGELLVEFKTNDSTILNSPSEDNAINDVYKEFGIPVVTAVFQKPTQKTTWDDHRQGVKQRFSKRANRSRHKPTHQLGRFFKLHFSVPDDRLAQIIERLRHSQNIQSVSHNTILHANAAPNDTYLGSSGSWGQAYEDLWGLYKVSANKAWISGTTGSSNIIIGVVDTGLDLTHADILDNLYTNPSETAGNGSDDDGNGYLDDTVGWDFTNDDNDPTDDFYHGTHVAGTIAATANNATGILGMMWDAQILPVKVLDAAGSGDTTTIANGIVYAADQGADAINLSLGGGSSSTLEAAVEYAYSLGSVVIAAAGNDSDDAMNSAPGMYDEAITVASSSPDDELSSFSNFGPKTDVTAPGEDILSLLAAAGTVASTDDSVVGTNYLRLDGTSMAAPHVTGAVGLLLANDSTLTVEEIRQAIRMADDIGDSRWDEETGYGRLNINKALRTNKCEALITDPDHNAEITSSLTVSGYAGGADFHHYVLRLYENSGTTSTLVVRPRLISTAVSNGSLGTLTITSLTPGASYSIRLIVFDSSGNICGRDRKEVSGSYIVGTYDTAGTAYGVAVDGNYAYVADYTSGLQIVDISTPASPTLVSNYDTSGFAMGVTVNGSYAYVADFASGLQVIDISTPASPTLVGTYDTPGRAWGVTVNGSYAYVADLDSGLQVIDVSTPTSPALVGNYDTAGSARNITVDGSYAYVADSDSGLQIIDISTPASPTLVGSYDTPGTAYNVAVDGNYAYVADSGSGLQVIDISTPTSPTLVGSYDTLTLPHDVVIDGNYAYLGDTSGNSSGGLQIVDISAPVSPIIINNYDTPGYPCDVAIDGNYAYVADFTSGLQVIDISTPAPTSPILAGSYDSGITYNVTVNGNYAYVSDFDLGLQIIDVSTSASPILVGSYDTSNNGGIAVSDNYAYVADGGSGLQIIDISTPTSPTLVGSYDTGNIAFDVAVDGICAYVADYQSGLQIIDISTPSSPVLLGSYDTSGLAVGIAVEGNYAYVADSTSGLQIIDISVLASPTLVGNYDTPGNVQGVAIEGNYAYVADSDSGLQIIDISTPTSPILVGNYDTSGTAMDVAIDGNYAYVADLTSGLQIIDISIPASPTLMGSYDTDSAEGVAVNGNYAYVADGSSGLQIIYVRIR